MRRRLRCACEWKPRWEAIPPTSFHFLAPCAFCSVAEPQHRRSSGRSWRSLGCRLEAESRFLTQPWPAHLHWSSRWSGDSEAWQVAGHQTALLLNGSNHSAVSSGDRIRSPRRSRDLRRNLVVCCRLDFGTVSHTARDRPRWRSRLAQHWWTSTMSFWPSAGSRVQRWKLQRCVEAEEAALARTANSCGEVKVG